MTTPETNEELVRRGFDALNERNREAFAEVHASDLVYHDVSEEIRGIEAVEQREWARFEAFPDMEYAIEDVLVDGDEVACRWTVTGTHEGEFEGIAPTGEEVEFPTMGVFRVEDGKIAEIWLSYDALGLMQQLGVVEPPGEDPIEPA